MCRHNIFLLCLLFYERLVRMNFSHGSYEYHQSVIDNTRKMVARKFILHLLHLAVCERSSIRGSQWSSCCYRFRHSQSIYLISIKNNQMRLPQKGPEIRTGLTRDGKDVRHSTYGTQSYLIIFSSTPFLLATSSPSPLTPNTEKFATTRSCGSTT